MPALTPASTYPGGFQRHHWIVAAVIAIRVLWLVLFPFALDGHLLQAAFYAVKLEDQR